MKELEVVVSHGQPSGAACAAHVPGTPLTWRRRPAETEAAFRMRVRTEAVAAGAEALIWSGMPE